MVTAVKFNSLGERMEEIELPANIFDVDVDSPKVLLHEVVTMYLGNQRQGTVQKKSRGMVRGSTRKLFRQKGTGNARMGSRRSPIRVGGGIAFAINPKDWYRRIPRKKKRMALKVALTDRAREGRVFVIESFDFSKPNTKQARELLEKIIPEKGRKLVVTDGNHHPTVRSFTNLGDVIADRADSLHAYEVLKSSYVLLTSDALSKVEEVFGK